MAGKTLQAEKPKAEYRWDEVALEPFHLLEGKRYSMSELVLMKRFKRAWQGDLKAVRDILKMLSLHTAARKVLDQPYDDDWCDPKAQRRRRARRRDEHTADPALLLLGIAVVDNGALHKLGEPGDEGFDKRLLALSPTHLAEWVVEFAQGRPGYDEAASRRHAGFMAMPEDHRAISQWRGRRADLLARIVAARGPGATKFRKGVSPNPRGRPRRRKVEPVKPDLPYGDFFNEMVSMPSNGRVYTVSRLDALMCKLMSEALKGDEKLEALVAPIIIALEELNWKTPPASVPIVDLVG